MKTTRNVVLAVLLISAACAAEDVVSAVHGAIEKVDSVTKTIVVKTADGTEHSMHFTDEAAVHGADASTDAAKDSWHGLEKGTEVVVHVSKDGSQDTAVEIDRVGETGLKASDGTIEDVDRGGRKLVVRSNDGVVSTYRLTDHAAQDGGRDIGEGTEKGTKITVYYTEAAGKRVAHFFERG